jgi:alpha/beta superfamily hydrolase
MDVKNFDLRKNYDLVCDCIIRPPRASYDIIDLGPNQFRIGNQKFQRTDLELVNPRGLKLQCCHYEPAKETRSRQHLPCVVYLHGNAGCRMDGLNLLRLILPYNITLLTFDFSGCGHSEGEFISLGYFEKDDVQTVTEYLRKSDSVSRIALWGRSMGAATAILFGATDPSIAGLVLDSPFSSLHTVAKELVEINQLKIPKLLVSGALKLIRSSIQDRAHFDIKHLKPLKSAPSCFVPALFVHGSEDNFILPHHSKDIQKVYGGESNLIIVDGDHNSDRPSFCMDSITIFLHNTLLTDEDKFNQENYDVDASLPVIPESRYAEQPPVPERHFPEFLSDIDEDDLIEQAIALSLLEQQEKSAM